jgi:hypothetical protein
MGVERAVTRWYVQRQLILAEIAHLEEKQKPFEQSNEEQAQEASVESAGDLQLQMEEAQKRLKALGHCPRPMMG